MKTKFLTVLMLATLACYLPGTALGSAEEDSQHNKISMGDWQKLMTRIRIYDEAAITELMDIVNAKRCPGTAEELIAMLKIAAGMGEKRAQYLLAACYREGVGVRENGKIANVWEIIYNHY